VIWRSDSAGNGLGLTDGHGTSGIPVGPGTGAPGGGAAGAGPPGGGAGPPGGSGGSSGAGLAAPGRSGPSWLDGDDEEHYVPPPPPPLPSLSPVAKGAWLALFGGPAYLVIATLVGWTVSGLAMFLSVGAFIAGFTILVLHLGDRGSDSDDDDGAVV
jgi:hypothetical protein